MPKTKITKTKTSTRKKTSTRAVESYNTQKVKQTRKVLVLVNVFIILSFITIPVSIFISNKINQLIDAQSTLTASNPLDLKDMLWEKVTSQGPITRAEHAPFNGHQAARDDSIVAYTSPKNGTAPYSALFTVKTGDQPGSNSGYRAEIYDYVNNEGTEKRGTDGFYAFSFYLPTDFSSPTWTIFHQMHGSYSGSQPAVDFLSNKNNFEITVKGGTTVNGNRRTFKIESNITKGQWHEIVYYAKWQPDSSGQFKAWHRLKGASTWREVANTNGPLGYLIGGKYYAPYPKLGIYRSTSNGDIITRVYHGGIRLHAPTFSKATEIFGSSQSSNVISNPGGGSSGSTSGGGSNIGGDSDNPTQPSTGGSTSGGGTTPGGGSTSGGSTSGGGTSTGGTGSTGGTTGGSQPPVNDGTQSTGGTQNNVVKIPETVIKKEDGNLISDFNGDTVPDVAIDTNNDGSITPDTEIVVDGATNPELVNQTAGETVINTPIEQTEVTNPETTIAIGPIKLSASKTKIATIAIGSVLGAGVLTATAYMALTHIPALYGLRMRIGI